MKRTWLGGRCSQTIDICGVVSEAGMARGEDITGGPQRRGRHALPVSEKSI